MGGIVIHKDVYHADADDQFALRQFLALVMTLIVNIVAHPLKFLLLQCYEVGIIPVVVVGQQSLGGV